MEKIKNLRDYIGLPVYVKGFCWNHSFDGWTVIFTNHEGDLRFNYKGRTYSVVGFLPTRFSSPLYSDYNNAFYVIEGEQALRKEISRLKEALALKNLKITSVERERAEDSCNFVREIEKIKAETIREYIEKLYDDLETFDGAVYDSIEKVAKEMGVSAG